MRKLSMSDPTPAGPVEAGTPMFPILTPEQIARVRSCPHVRLRTVNPGDVLFKPNDTDVPFFILLSGGMEIVQPGINGERDVATHGPGGFTGEMTMISEQRCLVTG